MSDKKYLVSSTPHIRSNDSTRSLMRDVLIALAPATLAGVWFFGVRAAIIIFMSIAWSIIFEQGYQRLMKKPSTISDLSAVVTGLLLAMNMPASAPIWMPIVGSFVAIVIVKQLFGGLGQNFVNPALAARAFLLASYPTAMTAWTEPVKNIFSFDLVSTATPLYYLKQGGAFTPQTQEYVNALIGNIPGCIGETSAIALLLGGAYLLYRKVITWHAPLAYIATASFFILLFGRDGFMTGNPMYELLVGGIMLGAFFMATDYATGPVSNKGRIVFGVGCGLLTALIRSYGGYPEGVSYAILIMNLAVPLIDRFIRPIVFGTKKGA